MYRHPTPLQVLRHQNAGGRSERTQELNINGRMKLNYLHTYQGSSLLPICRALSRSLPSHPSAAHGRPPSRHPFNLTSVHPVFNTYPYCIHPCFDRSFACQLLNYNNNNNINNNNIHIMLLINWYLADGLFAGCLCWNVPATCCGGSWTSCGVVNLGFSTSSSSYKSPSPPSAARRHRSPGKHKTIHKLMAMR